MEYRMLSRFVESLTNVRVAERDGGLDDGRASARTDGAVRTRQPRRRGGNQHEGRGSHERQASRGHAHHNRAYEPPRDHRLKPAGAVLGGLLAAARTTSSACRSGPGRAASPVSGDHRVLRTSCPTVERIRAFATAMMEPGRTCHSAGRLLHAEGREPRLSRHLERVRRAAHHVLGNHDMDGGFSREQAAAFYGMPARTTRSTRVVPRRGAGRERPGGKAGGYRRYVAANQLDWLSRNARISRAAGHRLRSPSRSTTSRVWRTVREVRAVLEKAEAARPGSVLATFAGHLHWTTCARSAACRTCR